MLFRSEFIATPVEVEQIDVYPAVNYGTAVTPFYTALALWVGGIVLVALMKVHVDNNPKMELMAKGIGRDLVDAALEEEYVSDDQKKIAELLQKRHYSFEDADVSEQRKNYQFLLRRGFKSSDILHVMKQERQ